MLRDTLKNQDYFDNYIKTEYSRIGKFVKVLDTTDKSAPQYIQCKKYIANFYRNLINAAYSAGYSKDELNAVVKKYFEYFVFDADVGYADVIDALSLIILFDVNTVEINKNTVSDTLIQAFCTYIESKKCNVKSEYNLLYKNQYEIYMDALTGKINCEEFVSYINDNWYDLNADMYWFDSHKKATDTYTGYWCWVGAAIAKMLNYPNNVINSSKYIPYEIK